MKYWYDITNELFTMILLAFSSDMSSIPLFEWNTKQNLNNSLNITNSIFSLTDFSNT